MGFTFLSFLPSSCTSHSTLTRRRQHVLLEAPLSSGLNTKPGKICSGVTLVQARRCGFVPVFRDTIRSIVKRGRSHEGSLSNLHPTIVTGECDCCSGSRFRLAAVGLRSRDLADRHSTFNHHHQPGLGSWLSGSLSLSWAVLPSRYDTEYGCEDPASRIVYSVHRGADTS